MRTAHQKLTLGAWRGALAIAFAVSAFSAVPAQAQFSSCGTDNGTSPPTIFCSGGTRWCGGTCASDPSVTCSAPSQSFSCGSCNCTCSAGYSSCGGSCPATASCGANQVAQCSGASSVCACAGGYVDCDPTAGFNCVLNTGANSCLTPVYVNQSPAQSGAINVTGDIISSTGNMYLNGSLANQGILNMQGDLYMRNTKSIRMDSSSGETKLYLGNWGGGTGTFALSVMGNIGVRSNPAYALDVSQTQGGAGDTAMIRLDNNNASRIWTGLRLDRGTTAGTEKWFTGMNATDDAYRIRRNGTTDDLIINSSGNVVLAGSLNAAGSLTAAGLGSTSTLGVSGTSSFGNQITTFSSNPLITGTVGASSTAYILSLVNNVTGVFSVTPNGRLSLGSPTVTTLSNPQALIYSNVNTASDGYFLRFQKAGTDNFSVDALGNVNAAGNLTTASLQVTGGAPAAGKVLQSDASGNATWSSVTVNACAVTRRFVGLTAGYYDGNLDAVSPSSPAASATGYPSADALCNAMGGAYTGSKVCTTDEILDNIKCGELVAGTPFWSANGNSGWINGGPPGYSASTNDCAGWTSDSSAATTKGRIWTFSNVTGGAGWLSFCDSPNKRQFSCCK